MNKFILISAFLLLGFFGWAETSSSAWTPPIGIPAPAFGIDQSHTMYQGQLYDYNGDGTPEGAYKDAGSGPYTHYINHSAGNCADGSNYGTPAQPRCTIPGDDGSPLMAGSVVEIHGQYNANHTSPNDWHGAGTAAKPIFIRGAAAADKPLLTGPLDVLGSSYVVFENLEFSDRDGNLSGGDTGSFSVSDKNGQRYDSDHIVLRNSDVHGNLQDGGTGIGGYGSASVISNIVFYNNKIHNNGDWQATFDQDNHGIGVGGNTNNIWVIENEMSHNSGDGIQINGFGMSNPALLNHIYVGRNISHHNKQSGFWTKTAADVIFSQNISYSHRPSDSSGGAGMGFQYAPNRVWFLYNHVYDSTCGICSGSDSTTFGQDSYIIGNVIHNIKPGFNSSDGGWGSGAMMLAGGINRYIIGNTIYDADAGINTPSSRALYVYDNIISNITNSQGNHIYIENTGTWEAKNNLFFQNGSAARIRLGNTTYSAPQLQSSYLTLAQANLTADPLFVNSGGSDFRLQSNSPAKDAAMASSAYGTFQSLYGIDIRKDILEATRPQGSAWDIGAYEYVSSASDIISPAAPAGLIIN